jgi:hypothetical protein
MKNHKPLLIILLTLISTSIFAQDYDLDSLVKTHKKVAILPVKVKYNAQKFEKAGSLKEMKVKELEDGLTLQEKFCKILQKESNSLDVEIQSSTETNQLLADNEITLQDLKDLPSNFIGDALKVDGIIQIELRLNQHLPDRGNTENVATRAVIGVLLASAGVGVIPIISADNNDKTISSKMIIRDGKFDEVIKKITLTLNDGIFNDTDKVIEKLLLTNFKKSPYYRK